MNTVTNERLLSEIALFEGQLTAHQTFIREFISNRFETGPSPMSIKNALANWITKDKDQRKILNSIADQKCQQLEVLFQIDEMLIENFSTPDSHSKQVLSDVKQFRKHIKDLRNTK